MDVRDLTSGFFLLCAGNKSVKLASAFRLLDVDGRGQLSRGGVWRFLRCRGGCVLCLYPFENENSSASIGCVYNLKKNIIRGGQRCDTNQNSESPAHQKLQDAEQVSIFYHAPLSLFGLWIIHIIS